MKKDKSSASAEATALVRAIEAMKSENTRVLYDPYAKHFLSTGKRIIADRKILSKIVIDIALWIHNRKYPGIDRYAYVTGRDRYIDDYLELNINAGIDQLVILGAGYDTRALRFDRLKNVKVFEVDRPTTQQVKKEKVKAIFNSLPSHVVYVPVDFNREKLDRKLFENGYDKNLKTMFIWEGVTFYLTTEAVDDVLSFIANNSGRGSSVIFDYFYKSVIEGTYDGRIVKKEVITRLLEKHISDGEPLTFGIAEGAIEEFLVKRNFCKIKTADNEFLNDKYFEVVNRSTSVNPVMCIAYAEVKI
ncbi:MAG: SAM-dependent methyltransferase [Proteobacteria bacterium]|nr:SAM-dependent methyltransferase [Pseudomonadota bacterium]